MNKVKSASSVFVAEALKAINKKKSKASDKIILLDPGHGGVIDGVYQTPGKRAYFKDGELMSFDIDVNEREKTCDSKIYEGEVNRIIVSMIHNCLNYLGVVSQIIVPNPQDESLRNRVSIVNKLCAMYGSENVILLSVHSNGWKAGSAHGVSFYTSIGETGSDSLATMLYLEAMNTWPKAKFRTDKGDGDLDKEANFYMLRKTNCRAVLGECFFHTNPREANYLGSVQGQQAIAAMYCRAIIKMLED